MHAHTFATPERMQAPSQMLRGVAGTCAPVAGVAAEPFVLGGSICPAPRQARVDVAHPSMATAWFSGSDRDFGSSAGGGPV